MAAFLATRQTVGRAEPLGRVGWRVVRTHGTVSLSLLRFVNARVGDALLSRPING
jgi:hypothetical protein